MFVDIECLDVDKFSDAVVGEFSAIAGLFYPAEGKSRV